MLECGKNLANLFRKIIRGMKKKVALSLEGGMDLGFIP